MSLRDPHEAAAAAIFAACQRGERWDPAALDALVAARSSALFSHLVEPLSDAFEPRYCGLYADLFARVLAGSADLDAAALRDRYERIRHPAAYPGDAAQVCVLSRVTLGADIAVTSVLLDAAKRRFPRARIWFAGPAKNYELFDADPRIEHLAAPYGRGASLAERVKAGLALRDLLPPGALVLDPDSRLTQLGLLPIAPPERHLFFESRGYGGDGNESMTALARRWCASVLDTPDARSYVATRATAAQAEAGQISVSMGTGGNAAKGLGDSFEGEWMKMLAGTGRPVLVDLGAGGEEEARVRRAVAAATPSSRRAAVWNGSFANFASAIAASALYTGYDSSGQHAAAVFGIPRVTVFAGYPSERFFARWQPDGSGGSHAIRASGGDATARMREAVESALAPNGR